jgi:hypothetical protein
MNKFDGIFILQLIKLLLSKKIFKNDDIKIIDRNNTLYEIKISNIKFRDSYQILNSSLNSIASSFLNESKFEINYNFDYKFIKYKLNEIITYCYNDVSILYRSLIKFQIIIFDKFKIDFTTCLTISSLAFKIIRLHYLTDDTIQNTDKEQNITSFISQSYRGGFTTVITPISDNYDIMAIDRNSSYPFSMTLDLPIGIGV